MTEPDQLISPEQDRPPQSRLQRSRSITTLFTIALVSISLLLTTIAVMVFHRLTEFQSILNDITGKSIPAVVNTDKINAQVNTLTYLIESLVQVNSAPAKRIAHRDIEQKIKQILTITHNNKNATYIQTQVSAINDELVRLEELIDKKLIMQRQLDIRQNQLFVLQNSLHQKLHENPELHVATLQSWVMNYSAAILQASHILTYKRINQLHQSSDKLKQQIQWLQQQQARLPNKFHGPAKSLLDSLNDILFSNNGLLPLRAEFFKVNSRAAGRENFVRSLVLDFARISEFETYQLNNQIIDSTQKITHRVKEQTRLLGILTALALFFLIAVAYVIQVRVVSRLKLLNKKIETRLLGDGSEPHTGLTNGRDEIADIARSFNYFAEKIEQQKLKLEELSLTDSLTGIANRRALDERLKYCIDTAQRHQWPLAILLMDVDCFKAFNDNYGHNKGDECLRQIAEVLMQCKRRDEDFVARHGGEEFIILLPQSDRKGTLQVAELLLKGLAEANIPHQYSPIADHVTVSIGISWYDYAKPIDQKQLIKNADLALYEAKRQGRNRYVEFTDVLI